MLPKPEDIALFDCLPHGYCIIDSDFTILSWNRSLEEWSGELRSEMIGKSLLNLQPKLNDPHYKLRFDLVFNTGTPFVFSPLIHEQVVPCKIGEVSQVHRTYLVKYQSKDIKAALLVVENVTRSHQSMIRYRNLTEELEAEKTNAQKMTDELTKANDELSQFAYRTSHDLKAPITTTRGLLSYILEDLENGDINQSKKDIKKIKKLMDGLDVLIGDIFALVKADLDTELEEVVDFTNVLDGIEKRLEPLAESNLCELNFSLNTLPNIILEKGRVTQILENIISNGIKYRDPDKTTSYVNVEVTTVETLLVIKIYDNGIGIPEKFHDDVFKMFKRFSPNHSFGSGLGMSIVKKHVEYLNGTINFTTSSEGTCFTISIPVKFQGMENVKTYGTYS